jgi:hypothetical protein
MWTLSFRIMRDPAVKRPILYGMGAGLIGAFVAWRFVCCPPLGTPGPDIDFSWWAGQMLLHHGDPYAGDGGASIFGLRTYYPLTAGVIALPLALLPLDVARGMWVIGTAALLGYAIGRYRPELWPTFLGIPFFVALRSAQWSPILTASVLIPGLGFLAAAKPNLGLAMLAGVRSKRAAALLVGGGIVVVLVSLAIDPRWPWKWRDALETSTHFRPLVMHPGGFLALLGLLSWRDPDARMVVALALVPITGLFYDVLLLCLVARSWQQSAGLSVVGLIGWQVMGHLAPDVPNLSAQMYLNGNMALWFGVLPALLLVLARRVWPDTSEPGGPGNPALQPGVMGEPYSKESS